MSIDAILSQRDGGIHIATSAQSVAQVSAMIAEKRIGALPVVENDKVVGIFSERDLVYGVARTGAAFLDMNVCDVMTKPAITIERDISVLAALSLMTKRRIRHLPVVEGSALVGFVSIGDLVKYRIEMIESEAAAMRDYIQNI